MSTSVIARIARIARAFTPSRSSSSTPGVGPAIGSRLARLVSAWHSSLSFVRLAFALFLLGGLPGAIGGTSARADFVATAYVAGDGYVGYDSNNVPCSGGTIQDIGPAEPTDGHVYDLYGNLLTINADASISDSGNNVVGFVCVASSTPML